MTTGRAVQIAPWLVFAAASMLVGSLIGANTLELQPGAVAIGSVLGVAAILAWARRNHAFASPVVLMGLPLLLGLAAATTDVTRIATDWTPARLAEVSAIAIAPILGAGLARCARGTPRFTRATLVPYGEGKAEVDPARIVAVCAAMLLVGAPILALEFARIGGPPLLSGHIDESRGLLITNGPLHIFTEGVSISLMIATWAIATQYRGLTASQRAILGGVIASDLILGVLQGGRLIVIMPIVAACVAAGRHVSKRVARRGAVLMALVVLLYGGVFAVGRGSQGQSEAFHASVTYTNEGYTKPLWVRALDTLIVNAGEQDRVILEVRAAHAHSGPFRNTVYFVHRFLPRAIPSGQTALDVTRVWVTGTYALDFLLDFGLVAALLAGAAFGGIAYILYCRYCESTNVAAIWLYANFAGPMTLAFYTNMFTAFAFVWIDLLVVVVAARVVSTRPSRPSRSRAAHAA